MNIPYNKWPHYNLNRLHNQVRFIELALKVFNVYNSFHTIIIAMRKIFFFCNLKAFIR
jgi:hypothetical protein